MTGRQSCLMGRNTTRHPRSQTRSKEVGRVTGDLENLLKRVPEAERGRSVTLE